MIPDAVDTDPEAELRRLRHDLRTPLAVILGFAELLGPESLDDATRREYAGRVAVAAREMRDVLDGAAL